jgi:hypothetical protein
MPVVFWATLTVQGDLCRHRGRHARWQDHRPNPECHHADEADLKVGSYVDLY